MKQKIITISLAAVMFLLALGLTLYPLISNNYNEKHQSEIHTAYLQYTSKHRLCDTTRQLVRGNPPETPKQMEE